MESRSQDGIEGQSEEELVDLLSKVKSARQTQALRARLPAPLAPFASNITIADPIKDLSISKENGIYYSAFDAKERQIRMAITVVPASGSSSEAEVKILELVWQNWWTTVKYGTGVANSSLNSITLNYGPPDGAPVEFSSIATSEWHPLSTAQAEAFTAEYFDAGISRYEHAHGEIKSHVRMVVRDLGFLGDEIDELGVIEALLGGGARESLERKTLDDRTLKEVIENELEGRYDS